MIYSLNGILLYKDATCAVVDCGGVGYRCACSMTTLKQLPRVGDEAFLFTFMKIGNDALDLYGFAAREELDCFKLLTTVSGVGGKAALSILSELDPDQFALCVAAGDFRRLQKAQGVGQKIAQRIVVDLKDKVSGIGGDAGAVEAMLSDETGGGKAEEAVSALVSLGYSRGDAAAAVAKLETGLPVEELIRGALKRLASR